MYEVKSKYKNPDRYIEELKSTIKQRLIFSENDAELIEKEQGKLLFKYSSVSTKRFALSDRTFGDLKVRQHIAVHGMVQEIKENIKCLENGEDHSEITLDLTEVRIYED